VIRLRQLAFTYVERLRRDTLVNRDPKSGVPHGEWSRNGCVRHRWAKPRGRNERERVSQSPFR